MCGKAIFSTEREAKFFVKITKKVHGYYLCKLSNTWHVTKHHVKNPLKSPYYGSRRFKFDPDRLMRELKQDMTKVTLGKEIIEYMQDMYTKQNVYKISSKMVTEFIQSVRPTVQRNHIASEISALKKTKVIVNLDEKVPDQPGALYFALSSVLDEVTKPAEVFEETENNEVSEVKPVANTFDSVNAQLADIMTKLEVLDSGLKLHGKSLEIHHNEMSNQYNSQTRLDKHYWETTRKDIEELKTVASSHVTVDGDKLADVINKRLGDLTLDDSFVYRVREEIENYKLRNAFDHDPIQRRLDEIEELWKRFAKDESEDYKRGIKDGIQIAVEMGIFIPDGTK